MTQIENKMMTETTEKRAQMDPFPTIRHEVDFCVVGGGMAGICAALSAARLGLKVVLMHDRPVLGGNASSEMRVHICGADRHNRIPNMRETGILEELRLDNLRRNPNRSFSIWDTILFEKVRYQQNLTLLLNCSCLDAEMEGHRIVSVTGWQLTTQTFHEVRARFFADCSGDAVLAPLTGALVRVGREARSEYGESIAPEKADARTMGMTCLFQTREYPTPQPFQPPSWAYIYEKDEDLPYGAAGHRWWEMGYWWVELGGTKDTIRDTESIRDELLKTAYGVWDHIKNRGDHGADNWALEWVQFLPAKRESRRYIGDHVLTQNDIEAGGHFDDIAAYGGWPMDDHHPAGFDAAKLGAPATIFYPTPSPYGIPFRSLYSRNINNLLFAGRCASCTHAAMSSTRVMGTACSMGQAVGTAVVMAVTYSLTPREIAQHYADQLQQSLLWQDCYLPGIKQRFGPITQSAHLIAPRGDPEPLRDGINRPVGDDPHCWEGRVGDRLEMRWDSPQPIDRVTLILDSALSKNIQMSYHQRDDQLTSLPGEMVKEVALLIQPDASGDWELWGVHSDNHQRLLNMEVHTTVYGVRVVFLSTWGAERFRVYAMYVD